MSATPPPARSDPDPVVAASPAPPGPGSTFSAFVVDRAGDTVDAEVRTLGPDDLPPGEVLIRVRWSAVNYKDGMVTRPGNRVARLDRLIPGVDLVGTVLASDEPTITVGQEVIAHGYDLGIAHHGGFAELARVPAAWVVPLPEGLTARRAATIGTAGFTAALSLHRLEHQGLEAARGPVLVTGASGGVGSLAVSLLASRGYRVVASTGKSSEHGYLLGLGAAEVIGRDDLVSASERTLGPERWAGAVDCVGGPTLSAVLRTLDYGAAVAASGLTGGNTFESTVYPFIVRNVSLIGIDTVRTPIAERRSVWDEMATAWPSPVLDGMVDDELALDQLGPALDRILSGGVRGRMLVRPTS
ncbi:MAG TPA: acryloyl-CoA reductase [Acidimicrobiales bacterium]|jgi:acrylyl-CoA reductase (NADPH)|nr:acryloyl-CoA reductase [Acidimicrobiales bacterium]